MLLDVVSFDNSCELISLVFELLHDAVINPINMAAIAVFENVIFALLKLV